MQATGDTTGYIRVYLCVCIIYSCGTLDDTAVPSLVSTDTPHILDTCESPVNSPSLIKPVRIIFLHFQHTVFCFWQESVNPLSLVLYTGFDGPKLHGPESRKCVCDRSSSETGSAQNHTQLLCVCKLSEDDSFIIRQGWWDYASWSKL